jgi:hypothetical protein
MGIKEDFYNSPHLFQLEKIDRDDFGKEIPIAPNDLIEFWTKLGAGEFFLKQRLSIRLRQMKVVTQFWIYMNILLRNACLRLILFSTQELPSLHIDLKNLSI